MVWGVIFGRQCIGEEEFILQDFIDVSILAPILWAGSAGLMTPPFFCEAEPRGISVPSQGDWERVNMIARYMYAGRKMYLGYISRYILPHRIHILCDHWSIIRNMLFEECNDLSLRVSTKSGYCLIA